MLYPLSKLKIGQTARIILLFEHKSSAIRNRLLDLGFEPGTEVSCLLKKGRNEISAYFIKGAVIALRKEDASLILVEDLIPSPGFRKDLEAEL